MKDRSAKQGHAAPALALSMAVVAAAVVPAAGAQMNEFNIVWVTVGEAAAADKPGEGKAGRRLFMAQELTALSLNNVKVTRVEVQPTVIELQTGQRFCVSTLEMRAFGPDRATVKRAPLSIAVRQEHRERMGIERSDEDICLQPTVAGEYPVRFTSLLPSSDGTTRGAQVFVRVALANLR
jgi:hypothetical protein